MKTSEKIKHGLMCMVGCCCGQECETCFSNVYTKKEHLLKKPIHDAYAYIQQLEAELAAAKRERDAAVEDLRKDEKCNYCKHDGTEADRDPCKTCFHVGGGGFSKRNWQWRGVRPDTEVQSNG